MNAKLLTVYDDRKSHLLRTRSAFIFGNVSQAARSAAKGTLDPVDIQLRFEEFDCGQWRTHVTLRSTVKAADVHSRRPRFKGSCTERSGSAKHTRYIEYRDIFKRGYARHEQFLFGSLDDIEVLESLHHFEVLLFLVLESSSSFASS